MRVTILLLICLAAVALIEAGHHHNDRHDRRQEGRDDRRTDKQRDSRDDRRDDRRVDSREDRRESSREDRRRDSREDRRENNEEYRREDSREERREDSRVNSKSGNRENRKEYSKENRKEDRKKDSRENRGEDSSENRRENSRENKREYSNEDITEKGRKDNREYSNKSDKTNMRENYKKDRREEKNRDDRKSSDRKSESRQDSKEANENNGRQFIEENSESTYWQRNRYPWRDVVFENRGKIVNNGVSRDGDTSNNQNQALLDRLGYTQKLDQGPTTDMETLLKQKFLLSLLLKVNDKKTEEKLEELGQTLILDEQQYKGGLDDDMRFLVQLCVDGKMLRDSTDFNGMDPIHLRQLQGLFKLLLLARDWETFQRNACFARLHLNRVLVVNAVILAVKERQDTQELIIPAINEILPELFYDDQLLQKSRDIHFNDLVMERVTNKPFSIDSLRGGWSRPFLNENRPAGSRQGGWRSGGSGYFQPKKTWQEWRQEKIERQANRGGEQGLVGQGDIGGFQRRLGQNGIGGEQAGKGLNELRKIVLTEQKVDNANNDNWDQRISYLTRDSGLSNFWYSLGIDSLRQMRLRATDREEMDIESSEDSNESKIRALTPEQRKLMMQQIIRFLRVMQNKQVDTSMKQQTTRNQDSQERVQTTNVNNERLLKVNRRRLNQNVGSEEETQTRQSGWERKKDVSQSDSDEELEEETKRTVEINQLNNNRLLTTNRRRLNQQNWDNNSLRDNERNSKEEKQQFNTRRVNLLKTFGRVGKGVDMDRLLTTNSQTERGNLGAKLARDNERNSNEKEREFQDRRVNLLKTFGRMGKEADRIIQKLQDLRRERESDVNARKKQGQSVERRQVEDRDRLLTVNRRRLNNKSMIEQNQYDLELEQRLRKLQDSSEESQRDSDERTSNENIRQASKEEVKYGSSEERREQLRNLIDENRLLGPNRRWLMRQSVQQNPINDINAGQKLKQESDSSEERSQSLSDEEPEEQNRQYSKENRRILDQRRFGAHQRLMNNKNMIGGSINKQRTNQRVRKFFETTKERRQDSEELSKEESDEIIEMWNGNANQDERLLGVNRRRWPQRNFNDEINRQVLKQRWSNRENSDEITQQNSEEDQWMIRKNNAWRKNNERTIESSRQEDTSERYNSKQTSSEDSNEFLTNERLLAIGRRRLPRSLDSQLEQNLDVSEKRMGEMILANMQQVLARLRMERLSHQLEQKLGDKQESRQKNDSKRQKLVTRDNKELKIQLKNVENILKSIIEEELREYGKRENVNLNSVNLPELIGRIFLNRLRNYGSDIFQVWSHLMQTLSMDRNSLIPNIAQQLQDPGMYDLIEHILNAANAIIDNTLSYESLLLKFNDIQINDVKVDKLQTYFDTTDVDVLNALDNASLEKQQIELKNIHSTPVLRQQRLNHKSFSIKLDINAKRERRVVVRIFLGPKFDENGNELSINENRRNFMLLDAFTTNLLPGENTIKRKSSDINWTSRDSTPLSQIYRDVMLAIDGTQSLELNRLTGNNQRFPHRLLLPRGLPQGLPMQLFIIVSPQTDYDFDMEQRLQMESAVLGMGTAAIRLDSMPLGFPFDRRLDNEQYLLGSNVVLKEIFIYHDGEDEK